MRLRFAGPWTTRSTPAPGTCPTARTAGPTAITRTPTTRPSRAARSWSARSSTARTRRSTPTATATRARVFGLSPDAHVGAGARRARGARAARGLADLRREHVRAALDRLRPAAVLLPAVRGLRRARHVPELGRHARSGRGAWTWTRVPCCSAARSTATRPRAARRRRRRSGPSARASCVRWAGAFALGEHQRAVGKLVRARPRQDRPALDARRGARPMDSLPATPERGRALPRSAELGLPWLAAMAETRRARSTTARATSCATRRRSRTSCWSRRALAGARRRGADGAVARGAAARRRQAGHDALRERSLARARPRPPRRDHRPTAAVGGGRRPVRARAHLRRSCATTWSPHLLIEREPSTPRALHRDLARGRRAAPAPAHARRRARPGRRRRRRTGDQRRPVRRVRRASSAAWRCRTRSRPTTRASRTSRRDDRDPAYAAYDDTRSRVVVLSGLPGAGKDLWIARHGDGRPVVSLDDLRRERGVKRGDKAGEGRLIQDARERARAHLRAGEPFIWNATNLSAQLRGQTLGAAGRLPRARHDRGRRGARRRPQRAQPRPRAPGAVGGDRAHARPLGGAQRHRVPPAGGLERLIERL